MTRAYVSIRTEDIPKKLDVPYEIGRLLAKGECEDCGKSVTYSIPTLEAYKKKFDNFLFICTPCCRDRQGALPAGTPIIETSRYNEEFQRAVDKHESRKN